MQSISIVRILIVTTKNNIIGKKGNIKQIDTVFPIGIAAIVLIEVFFFKNRIYDNFINFKDKFHIADSLYDDRRIE